MLYCILFRSRRASLGQSMVSFYFYFLLRVESPRWMRCSKRPRLERSNLVDSTLPTSQTIKGTVRGPTCFEVIFPFYVCKVTQQIYTQTITLVWGINNVFEIAFRLHSSVCEKCRVRPMMTLSPSAPGSRSVGR